eukprot:TRINITY_DN25193_c0_g1_i1.p1 TRINITY_DN25193_c0_g1~~TRINITY_DN25193_c0_g1_i1.p1  ORF type:complete len:126 (-),score=3.27 TRINITY_DN25193_c0_g1_i1:501-878(-)
MKRAEEINTGMDGTSTGPALSPASLTRSSDLKRPLSRLQKRAPGALTVKIVTAPPDSLGFCNKSPIPLLSPLVLSPAAVADDKWMLASVPPESENSSVVSPPNGWQHPAAPFFVDSRKCGNLLQP